MEINKLVMHWTAGGSEPTFYDQQFYHYLVSGSGEVFAGIYTPEANLHVESGKYAMHCGGGNTGAIGVAMCGMAGYKGKADVGKYPITAKQLEAFFALCAGLCYKYNIKIEPQRVFTHYEFGRNNPKSTSAGKIDVTFLPPYPSVSEPNVGGFMRQKIAWYLGKGKFLLA